MMKKLSFLSALVAILAAVTLSPVLVPAESAGYQWVAKYEGTFEAPSVNQKGGYALVVSKVDGDKFIGTRIVDVDLRTHIHVESPVAGKIEGDTIAFEATDGSQAAGRLTRDGDTLKGEVWGTYQATATLQRVK